MSDKIVVCGAGGYVGRHMVEYLRDRHENVSPVTRAVADLTQREDCERVVRDAKWVFNFATAVGGIGFVTSGTAQSLRNVLINTHLVEACAKNEVEQYFFASSSCVYPDGISRPLRESDVYPANPMGGYGWEKLFSERTCIAYAAERGLNVCIGRYHGIYGPHDIRPAGKDHVVTALARKIALAKFQGQSEIEVWGNGEQTRSLLYISDCIEGTYKMMSERIQGPLNLAHREPMSVNEILDLLEDISGFRPHRRYNQEAPTGRQHKTSDPMEMLQQMHWEPRVTHEVGLRRVFNDMWDRVLQGA